MVCREAGFAGQHAACTAEHARPASSGDLVISVEHGKVMGRVIAGFRGCEAVAFEVATGLDPGLVQARRSVDLLKKWSRPPKSCKLKAPSVAETRRRVACSHQGA